MKGLNFKSILCATSLVLMLVSVAVMAYNMYCMAYATPFAIDPTSKAVTTQGVQAHEFWTNRKYWLVGPTVCNLMGMALVGMLLVMG